MRVKNKLPYTLKKKSMEEDNEGGKYATYTESGTINAYIYPASGRVQAEMYGEKLNYILNMLYDEDIEITEDDVIVYNNADYKVISIKNYTSHKLMELEKL